MSPSAIRSLVDQRLTTPPRAHQRWAGALAPNWVNWASIAMGDSEWGYPLALLMWLGARSGVGAGALVAASRSLHEWLVGTPAPVGQRAAS